MRTFSPCIVTWIVALPCLLFAQDKKTDIVRLSTSEKNRQESQFTLVITAAIDPAYHIYGTEAVEGPIATEVTLELPAGMEKAGAMKLPTGIRHMDEGFGVEVTWLSGKVDFEQPIRITGGGKAGDEIRVSLLYQACTESYCIPPKTITAVHKILAAKSVKIIQENPAETTQKEEPVDTSSVSVLPPGTTGGEKQETSLQERIASYDELRKESLASFIGLALLTGFLALLTPCVFPMIPITVSFFTKYSNTSRIQSLKKSTVYVAGIIVSFTIFGWLMSLIVGATGAQNFAANIWINLGIGALFVVFAISLFGVFEIRLPSWLLNLSQRRSDSGGYVGVLFAGITFTLVSFTCTVQFLGILMVASAQGEWFLPVIGMLCFAAAFSAPFFFLSLFPQYLASLPKSGGWLHATKIVMALVELAAAFKFFSNVDLVLDLEFLTRPALLSIWIVLFGLTGFYLLGKVVFSEDDRTDRIGFGRTSLAIFFLTITTYLIYGLFGNPLQADIDSYLPPMEYGRSVASAPVHGAEDVWIEQYAAGVEKARQTGKPMFIDFTGKTCTNCRLMEKTMFARADVRELFDKMVLVRLWTDFGRDMESNQELQQSLVGSVALPYYAVVSPSGEVLARFGGLERDPEIFKSFLRSGLQRLTAVATK